MKDGVKPFSSVSAEAVWSVSCKRQLSLGKCKFIQRRSVFHAVPLKTIARYENARVRSVIIWHSISMFQCRRQRRKGARGMRKSTVLTSVDASLCGRNAAFVTDGQKRVAVEGSEEFNGIFFNSNRRVMDMIQFLMPQLKIHKHELLI